MRRVGVKGRCGVEHLVYQGSSMCCGLPPSSLTLNQNPVSHACSTAARLREPAGGHVPAEGVVSVARPSYPEL